MVELLNGLMVIGFLYFRISCFLFFYLDMGHWIFG